MALSSFNHSRPAQGYAALSSRPLHILLFLLPLILLYEIGLTVYLSDQKLGVGDISARTILRGLFDSFGVASFHLPAFVLLVVLFLWHLMVHDPWKVRASTLVGMALESTLWAIPIFVLGMLLMSPARPAAAVSPGAGDLAALPWQVRLTISVGAGLYEELVFRLLLITIAHFLLVDLLRVPNGAGMVIAAVVSAVAFALYHNISYVGGGANLALLAFYCIAGLYFAALFLIRGFGIAVATHAIYDLVVLLAPTLLHR